MWPDKVQDIRPEFISLPIRQTKKYGVVVIALQVICPSRKQKCLFHSLLEAILLALKLCYQSHESKDESSNTWVSWQENWLQSNRPFKHTLCPLCVQS